MKKIIHVLSVASPSDRVYEALTTPAGLTAWWASRVDGSGDQGGELRFAFHGDFNPVMRVTSAKPGEHVRWTCTSGHEPWKDNAFSFTLEDVAGETQVTFVQEYARELSDTAYGRYNFNWGYYLDSLKQLCETGRGKPFSGA